MSESKGAEFATPARGKGDGEAKAPDSPVKPRKRVNLRKAGTLNFSSLAMLMAKAKAVAARRQSELCKARHYIDEKSEFVHPSPLRICVAVDGSEHAHDAFLDAVACMETGGHLTVIHIKEPPSTAETTGRFSAREVHTKYDHECVSRFPSERYSVKMVDRKEGKSLHDTMCEAVNAGHFQLMFVGLKGRRSRSDDPSVLGSTTDFSVRSALCTTVVVKTREHGTSPKVYVVGADGSLHSHNALLVARRLGHKGDKIYALNVHSDSAATLPDEYRANKLMKEYKQDIEEYAEEDRVAGRAELIWKQVDKAGSHTIADAIAEGAEELEADFLVVGADGLKATMGGRAGDVALLGSVSDRVVAKARCNVIVTETVLDMDIETGHFDRKADKK